jgi:hypothetical protein
MSGWIVALILLSLAAALATVLRSRAYPRRSIGAGAAPVDEPVARETCRQDDSPAPFGYELAWYAVRSTNTRAVAWALGLESLRAAGWREGIEAAYDGRVFVTPPVSGWTLACGVALGKELAAGRIERVLETLRALSCELGEARLFATHGAAELHAWARAEAGEIERAFAWAGESDEALADVGQPTRDEIDLGVAPDKRSGEAGEVDEQIVMELARRWSVAPVDLEPPPAGAHGILGRLPARD